jgi:acetolactate synthase-1/2/3 large subunit
MAHLGFGSHALALQAAHPGRTVVNVTGDGALGFTLAELDTARRHGLPVVTVIHDNAAWGVIRFGQARAGSSSTPPSRAPTTRPSRAPSAATADGHERRGDPSGARPALASGLLRSSTSRHFVPHPRCRASRR